MSTSAYYNLTIYDTNKVVLHSRHCPERFRAVMEEIRNLDPDAQKGLASNGSSLWEVDWDSHEAQLKVVSCHHPDLLFELHIQDEYNETWVKFFYQGEVYEGEAITFEPSFNLQSRRVEMRIPFGLLDRKLGEDHQVTGDILMEKFGLAIRFDEYGQATVEGDQGEPIYIEVWDSDLRAIVWSDINEEEPQIISLENARLEKREEGEK